MRLDKVIKNLSVSNAAIKNTASSTMIEGWYPTYSASGQDVWLPNFRYNQKGIVVSAVGARCGKAFKADGKWNVCANTHALSVDETIADRDYCWYMLNNESWWIKGGTAQPFVKIKDSLSREHFFPSLKEQKRIVERLDTTQKIIELQHREIDMLDNLVKARFVEMFGDTVLNPMGWEEYYLEEYIDFLTSGSRGWAQYFVDEENELFITIKNVKNNHISLEEIQYIDAPEGKEAERTKVKAGDLLISITADLGRTGVVDEDIASKGAYINQHLSLVRLDLERINPLYVSYFLETSGGKRQFERKNQNGVKAGLNFDAIKSLKILVPPLQKQNEYIEFVNKVDKSKVVVLLIK